LQGSFLDHDVLAPPCAIQASPPRHDPIYLDPSGKALHHGPHAGESLPQSSPTARSSPLKHCPPRCLLQEPLLGWLFPKITYTYFPYGPYREVSTTPSIFFQDTVLSPLSMMGLFPLRTFARPEVFSQEVRSFPPEGMDTASLSFPREQKPRSTRSLVARANWPPFT